MSEHPNAAFLRRLYHGDREALMQRMASDYVTHVPGRSLLAGDFFGQEHVTKHIPLLMQHSGGTLRKELSGSFLADDRWGCVPLRLQADRNGKSLDVLGFGIWRFREGAVVEHWALPADQYAHDDFFS